jgi:hypothetical protein
MSAQPRDEQVDPTTGAGITIADFTTARPFGLTNVSSDRHRLVNMVEQARAEMAVENAQCRC